MAAYSSFPAPSISSMGDESLSTEPPGSDEPLLINGSEVPASGADTDGQSKHDNATVIVIPASELGAGQQRRIGEGEGKAASTAAYHRLNPVRLIAGTRKKWRSYFVEKREVPKIVIHKGINKAWFAHTWVHIPPTLATAVLLGLNLWLFPNAITRGYYIGGTIPGPPADESKLNWLQFAAKLHEITIVASLSTVLWDMIRYYLVYKPLGVPLGLVGAGSAFTEAKFLFSKELHGIWRMDYGTWAKISVFAAISFFCVLANLAGPSSAILMIPRNDTWPVVEFKFPINGTADNDLWPVAVTKDHIGAANCTDPDAFERPACVSGAYRPINDYFASFISFPISGSFEFNSIDSRTSRTLHGNTRVGWANHFETWTMAPHAAAVAVHEEIRAVWIKRLDDVPLKYRDSFVRTIQVDTTAPVVRTACVPAKGLWSKVVNSSDGQAFPMDFPVIKKDAIWGDPARWPATFHSGETGQVNLSASLLDLADIVDGRDFVIKTHWVTLPDGFGDETAGLLILNSAADKDLPHGPRFDLGIGCVVDARWARSGNIVSSSQKDWAWAGFRYPTRTSVYHQRQRPQDEHGIFYGDRLFLPGSEEDGWKQMSLSEFWLNALTPPIPGRAGNASTLDAIFEDTIPNLWAVTQWSSLRNAMVYYHNSSEYVLLTLAEHVTASLVADGASRMGLGLQSMMWDLNPPLEEYHAPQGPDHRQKKDYFSLGVFGLPSPFNSTEGTQLVLKASVHGYGLNLEGVSGKLAAVVLCFHLLVVLLHIAALFFFFGNQTMATWKSSTDFLLLSMGSASNMEIDDEQREMLSRGGVGAERAATFGSLVRIEAVEDHRDSAPVQEVRLRLGKGTGGSGSMKHGKACIVSWADNYLDR